MPKTAPLKEIEEFERETDPGSLQYLDDNEHNWRRSCMKRAVFAECLFLLLSVCRSPFSVSDNTQLNLQSQEAAQNRQPPLSALL